MVCMVHGAHGSRDPAANPRPTGEQQCTHGSYRVSRLAAEDLLPSRTATLSPPNRRAPHRQVSHLSRYLLEEQTSLRAITTASIRVSYITRIHIDHIGKWIRKQKYWCHQKQNIPSEANLIFLDKQQFWIASAGIRSDTLYLHVMLF